MSLAIPRHLWRHVLAEKRIGGYLTSQQKIITQFEHVENLIITLRDQKIILDSHLANLDQDETKRVVEAIKRNRSRFPDDFVFQLTVLEFADLKKAGMFPKRHGSRRKLPYAFTEQGVAMASSV